MLHMLRNELFALFIIYKLYFKAIKAYINTFKLKSKKILLHFFFLSKILLKSTLKYSFGLFKFCLFFSIFLEILSS